MPASTCQRRGQLIVTLVSHRPKYRGHLKGAKQDEVQFNVGTGVRRGVSAPLTRTHGQQPVVALKEDNTYGAKGHSQSKENNTSLSVERQ